ncbi:MAG: hypothetical protein HQL48_09165 [Gammaproteobacteria bacterium]|nr:hypothetical protein [Gammaproteobacteria bacterium]
MNRTLTAMVLLLLYTSPSVAAGVRPLAVGDAPKVQRVVPLSADGGETVGSEQWVTAEGRSDMRSGAKVARKQALLNAYRNAISQGGSIEISEFSQLRNFRDVVDMVTKRTHGFIREYEILTDGPDANDGDKYLVAIRALVVDKLEPEKKGDDGLAQFVAMIGSPKVLFILSESGEGDQKSTQLDTIDVGSGVSGYDSLQVSSAEQEMAKRFRQSGYEVVTADDVLQSGFVTLDEIHNARKGLATFATKVGRAADADVVISGVVKYRVSIMSGGTDVQGQLGAVNLTAKAIMPGSGRVLHVVTNRQKYMSLQAASALLAREESLARSAKIAADELKWEIPKLLAQESREVGLTVSQVSYNQADDLRSYLLGLSGVEGVTMAGWKNSQAKYTVKCIYTGPRERDLVELLGNKYQKFTITEVSPYQIAGSF